MSECARRSVTRIRIAAALSVVAIMAGCSTPATVDAPSTATRPTQTASPEQATGSPASPPPTSADVSLVVVGDSIPYNSPEDCPGCTGFVKRYAAALAQATGRPVETTNLSQHNNLTLPGLVAELDQFKDQLSGADAIIVGIAHNSIALNSEMPCGSRFDYATGQLSDWTKVNQDCADASTAEYQPQFQEVFSKIAGWRSGRPTILLTINKYNDWIGWNNDPLTKAQEAKTALIHDSWNEMLCSTAVANQFTCVDIYHEFNGPTGRRAAGDLLADDYTHPSDKGNKLIAKTLIAKGFSPLEAR